MLDLLRRVIFRRRLRPDKVIADTTYGTTENIRAVEEMGIRAYVPLPDWEYQRGYFGPSHSTYDHERHVSVCPQGEVLRHREDRADKHKDCPHGAVSGVRHVSTAEELKGHGQSHAEGRENPAHADDASLAAAASIPPRVGHPRPPPKRRVLYPAHEQERADPEQGTGSARD